MASHYLFYAFIECRTCAAKKKKHMHLFSGTGLCSHLGSIFLIENQNIPWCLTNLQIEKSTSALRSNVAGEIPTAWKISKYSLNYISVHLQNDYTLYQNIQAAFVWERMLHWQTVSQLVVVHEKPCHKTGRAVLWTWSCSSVNAPVTIF